MKITRSRLALAVLLSMGAAAHAQQTQQDGAGVEKSVRSFLSSAEKEITQAVRAGDGDALMKWVQQHVADKAHFNATVELYRGDARKLLAAVSAEKGDLLSLQHSPMGAMPGMLAKALTDYSLNIDVRNVEPIGDQAAVVATRITEKGAFDMAKAALAEGKPPSGDKSDETSTAPSAGSASTSGKVSAEATTFEGTAMCQHLIRFGASGDSPQIVMTTCQGRMNL